MIVPCKGVTGDTGAIRDVVDTIDKEWGRGRVLIRTDQENPIEAFRSAVVRAREGETVVEGAVKGDSQSNGRAEKAVKDVSGMIRTWKDQVESAYGNKVGSGNVLIPWLFKYAGDVITRCRIDQSGRIVRGQLRV
jgi:hypothetical protein